MLVGNVVAALFWDATICRVKQLTSPRWFLSLAGAEQRPSAPVSDMRFVEQIPSELGAVHESRILEGAVDAIPPYFTTPKSVGSAGTNEDNR